MNIEAFGKKFTIPKEKLKDIPKLPYNGIRLSYKYGYKKLGGKTIYVSLYVGFSSGVIEKISITISESRKIEIE